MVKDPAALDLGHGPGTGQEERGLAAGGHWRAELCWENTMTPTERAGSPSGAAVTALRTGSAAFESSVETATFIYLRCAYKMPGHSARIITCT